jgi:FAD:protein FMN transferase
MKGMVIIMSSKTVFYAMGTENSIASEEDIPENALSKVVDRVFEIEEKMSAFKESSEISRLARNAGISPVAVSDDVYYVLEKALEISLASCGAFDITARPLTRLWNIGRGNDSVPEKAEIEAARGFVGYQSLILDSSAKTAFLSFSGSAIDLGGIAKGYAADEAKRILREHNIKKALINFGGNILVLGQSPENAPRKIGIQNPLSVRGACALTVDVSDKAVVTSAVNERFFIHEGIRYHHILNPLTGFPAQGGLLSATIIDASSLLADALSTAVFILGAEQGIKLVRKYHSEVILITDTGDILSSLELN